MNWILFLFSSFIWNDNCVWKRGLCNWNQKYECNKKREENHEKERENSVKRFKNYGSMDCCLPFQYNLYVGLKFIYVPVCTERSYAPFMIERECTHLVLVCYFIYIFFFFSFISVLFSHIIEQSVITLCLSHVLFDCYLQLYSIFKRYLQFPSSNKHIELYTHFIHFRKCN